jgi:hypothetical protein
MMWHMINRAQLAVAKDANIDSNVGRLRETIFDSYEEKICFVIFGGRNGSKYEKTSSLKFASLINIIGV